MKMFAHEHVDLLGQFLDCNPLVLIYYFQNKLPTKASTMIQDGQCILLDASITALEMVPDPEVATNSFERSDQRHNGGLELKENPGITVILFT